MNSLIADIRHITSLQFPPSVGPARIAEVSRAIDGTPIPGPLAQLWSECDGIFVKRAHLYLVWPVDQLINVAEDGSYSDMPPEMFAFGDDGTGAPFCLNVKTLAVERWEPGTGEREQLYMNLSEFLRDIPSL